MILLDTDILLDVALDRTPHVADSGALIRYLEARPRMAFVAWHTLANIYYLMRPAQGDVSVRQFLVDITHIAAVAPTDSDALRYAATLPLRDFEDAMQVAAARSCGARWIATRNVKDFRRSPIPALAPRDLLRELGEG